MSDIDWDMDVHRAHSSIYQPLRKSIKKIREQKMKKAKKDGTIRANAIKGLKKETNVGREVYKVLPADYVDDDADEAVAAAKAAIDGK